MRDFQKEQCVLFIVSPPGAGKTYLLEQQIMPTQSRLGVTCIRIDCSNDELVERAMESVLLEKFPREGQKSLLVAGFLIV